MRALSRAEVSWSRWVEAKAITDALVLRLAREDTAGNAPAVRVTLVQLGEARVWEAETLEAWEHQRSAGKPVPGVTCPAGRRAT